MRHFWRFEPDQPLPRFTAPQRAEAFIRTLSACAVLDIGEEIRVCAALAADRGDGREKERILRETLRLLNKLAHRKYRNEFEAAVSMLRAAATTRVNASPAFLAGLDRVEEKARKRGGGVFGPKPLQR
jgi:hypothetical protein